MKIWTDLIARDFPRFLLDAMPGSSLKLALFMLRSHYAT
jgi:hypothetical protein